MSSRGGWPGLAAAALLVCAGCGTRVEQPEKQPEPSEPGRPVALDPGRGTAVDAAASAPPLIQTAPAQPLYPPTIRSLRLRRSIAVRLQPTADSKRLGTVAQDTRVLFRSAVVAPGCEPRWIEIQPRGWVCESHLEPSTRPPDGVELPRVARGELVPGEYGKVASKARVLTWTGSKVVGERAMAGSAMVRRYGDEVVIRGAPYWRIAPNQYVRSKQIDPYVPSSWHGTRLGDDTGLALPLGFAMAEKAPQGPVPIYAAADATTESDKLSRRTVVQLLETSAGPDGRPAAYRIGDGQWLRAGDVRVAERTAPPPTTLPDERWIDIDLDRQVLVAYEGELPVYATLVSSGKKKTPTETGIFRVWIKFAETDMSGQMTGEEAYSVSTVPWTQYYAKDLALHTTYWHDRLGQPRSHGCVNLAPTDARFLYFWSAPDLPVGWSMANGVAEQPGSMVRARSAADPSPAFKGYAKHVAEARGARAALAPP